MADRALLNAHVRPMTSPEATATAIAWADGRIIAVGNDDTVRAEAKKRGIPIENATGKTVIPGFVDAHMHFLHVGVKSMRPDLRDAASLEDALETVRVWIEENPGDSPVTAEGWDESQWPEKRPPTREELDAVTRRPLVFRRIDGHYAVANSAALPVLRRRWDRDDRVDMETGVLLEDASLYLNEVLPASPQELDQAVDIATRTAHRIGVTAVGDYAQAPFRSALLRAAAQDRLRIRVASCIYVQQLKEEIRRGFRTGRPAVTPEDIQGANPAGKGIPVPPVDSHDPVPVPVEGGTSQWLRDGGLKVFHDGSFGGYTAWLHEPYEEGKGAGPDGCGTPIWSDTEALEWYRMAHEAGIQLHGHAIGDAAIDQALDAIDTLHDPKGARTLRHRIEHFELPTDNAVARTKKMGVVASCQPNFVAHWSTHGGMYEHRIGKRFLRNNRYRTWLDDDLRIAFGSDGMPFGPLFGIQGAVDHPIEEERISTGEAVWCYTAQSAWSLHWEDAIGTLAPGKHADLLVLDQDHLDAKPPQEWVFLETIQGGETVHQGTRPVTHA